MNTKAGSIPTGRLLHAIEKAEELCGSPTYEQRGIEWIGPSRAMCLLPSIILSILQIRGLFSQMITRSKEDEKHGCTYQLYRLTAVGLTRRFMDRPILLRSPFGLDFDLAQA